MKEVLKLSYFYYWIVQNNENLYKKFKIVFTKVTLVLLIAN